MSEHGDTRDEALARLTEEVERLLAGGEEIEPGALAERFEVAVNDVLDCIASVSIFGNLLDGDLDEPEPELPLPDLPADYEILEELGRGGMGVVYRARQKSLDRIVAVKVIRPGAAGFGSTVTRIKREARSLARLRHPGIVSVHEVGTAGDAVFFTMDYVAGGSLANRLKDGRLHPGEAVRILIQVGSAVMHTHERGIVHRDLKPANVLLDREGNAWVVDFGLARDSAISVDATGTGRILGTPAYMSPEQARGDAPIGEPTDIYSLGALLYECLTGSAPFDGKALAETIHAVLNVEPPPPRKRNPLVPKDLETIVLKAMAKRPGSRYATARAFLEDLRAFAEGRPIRAKRPGRVSAVLRFARRNRGPLAAGFLTAAAFIAGVVLFVVPRIGRTPETLSEMAGELSESGETRAALALYDEAIAKYGSFDEFGMDLQRKRADCRARIARGLLLDMRLDEAESAIDETIRGADACLGKAGWPDAGKVLWDRVRLLAVRGDVESARDAFYDLRKRLPGRGMDGPDGTAFTAMPDSRLEMLDLVAETAEDPEPFSSVAAAYLLVLSRDLSAAPVTDWVLTRGEDAGSILAGMVRAASAEEGIRAPGGEWGLDGILGAFARRRFELLMETLASLASSPAEPEPSRALALEHLERYADIPKPRTAGRGQGNSRVWDEEAGTETLALWKRIRDVDRAEAFRLRIDLAVARGAGGWLSSHTGHRAERATWNMWWGDHREVDPVIWLARQCRLPENADPYDIETVIQHLRRARKGDRLLVHQILTLIVPDEIRPPIYRLRGREPNDGLVAGWRRALSILPSAEPWVLQVAMIRIDDAEDPRILWREARLIRIGEPVELSGVHTEVRDWGASVGVPGFSTLCPPPAPERTVWSGAVNLDWGADGLRLWGGQVRHGTTYPGGGSTGGFLANSSTTALAGFVLSFSSSLMGYSSSGAGPRMNDFTLAVALPPGSEVRPWGMEDWQLELARNLVLLSAGAAGDAPGHLGPFVLSRQKSLRKIPRIVAKIGVSPTPEVREALRNWVSDTSFRNPAWIRARLMAGDADLTEDPELGSGEAADRDMSNDYAATWWTRLLVSTAQPRIRDLAAKALAPLEIPPRVRARIDRAIEDGLTVPEELRKRVRGADAAVARSEMEAVEELLVVGAVLILGAIVAIGFALWPGRPFENRLRPAAWMILLGIGITALHVYWRGTDLLHDVAGTAIALAGAVILARAAPGKASRCMAVGLALALVLVLVALTEAVTPWITSLSALGIAAAVLAAPWVADSLRSAGKVRFRHRVFPLLYGLPVAAFWGGYAVAMVRREDLQFGINRALMLFILLALGATVLWACLNLVVAAGAAKRQAP